MARAGAALNEPDTCITADEAAEFHPAAACGDNDGRLLHTWRSGHAKLDAYLDDYACAGQLAGQPLRSHFQRALDRRSGRADGHRAREIRRSGRRRVLLHGLRPRTAHRPQQRTDRQQHSQRQCAGGARRCCGLANCSVAAIIWMRPSERWPPRYRSCSERRWPPAKCCSHSIAILGHRTSWCSSATLPAMTLKHVRRAVNRRYLPRTVFAFALADPSLRQVDHGGSASPPRRIFDGQGNRPTASPCSTSARTSPAKRRRLGLARNRSVTLRRRSPSEADEPR